jgi:glycosyltransferase involved in cell wall biosynthesis
MNGAVVSIIMPVYNVEKYLDRSIKSVLAQTYKKIEIILVDDGSTDSSSIICDKYGEKYKDIIKIIHIPNGGSSNARNVGVSIASGKYICFVDPDDFISDRHVETLVDLVDDGKYQLGEVSYHVVDELELKKGHSFEEIKEKTITTMTNIEALNCFGYSAIINGYVWNKIYLRELIIKNNILFRTDIRLWEDMLFVVEYISVSKNVVVCNMPTYFYIQRGGSVIHSNNYNVCRTKIISVHYFEEIMNKLLHDELLSHDSDFVKWVKRIYSETCIGDVLNVQYRNNIFDRTETRIRVKDAKKYWKYLSVRYLIKLVLLSVCPKILYGFITKECESE